MHVLRARRPQISAETAPSGLRYGLRPRSGIVCTPLYVIIPESPWSSIVWLCVLFTWVWDGRSRTSTPSSYMWTTRTSSSTSEECEGRICWTKAKFCWTKANFCWTKATFCWTNWVMDRVFYLQPCAFITATLARKSISGVLRRLGK